jgi:hypothetical protein
MKRDYKNLIVCLLVFLFLVNGISGQSLNKRGKISGKRNSFTPSMSKLNINNITTYVYNNGYADVAPADAAGFIYPKGSGKTAIYQSGLLWGGYIDDYWSLGGSQYRSGLVPGRILANGTAEDPNSPLVRIYRVRSDYKNFGNNESMALLFASEIEDEAKTAQEIYAQYDLDWKQWPAQYGAPFIDKNGDGIYNPDIDVPGMSEEPCQTIWFVANDLDPATTQKFYGTSPLKLEMQATFWAFKAAKPIGNTIFKKYKIINKNSKRIEPMYFCMWSDSDLGFASDDCVGCDTTLNLSYAYNASVIDDQYKDIPPAVGFVQLQGPVINGSSSDSAFISGRWKKGIKSLAMTAFFFSYPTNEYSDPIPETNEALKWKNVFEGLQRETGQPFIDPTTGKVTKFPFNGNPVTSAGWLDTYYNKDKTMGNITGPFIMNPGDTQEVVYAQTIAGATAGVGRRPAISLLKFYSKSLIDSYNNTDIPHLLPAPVIKASELDNSIILSWSDLTSYQTVENYSKGGFKFEGYNIYQMPKSVSTINEGLKLATYDLVNGINTIISPAIDETTGVIINKAVALGTDSGIKRYCTITEDKIKEIPTLYNGSDYYFTVTAYFYNPDQNIIPNVLESPVKIITVTPQSVNPGTRYTSSIGETIQVSHDNGVSDGSVLVKIIDPKRGDGKGYTITFNDEDHYNILQGTTALYVNKPIAGISGDNPIIAGAQIHVVPNDGIGLKSTRMVSGTNPFDEAGKSVFISASDVPKYKGLWNGGMRMGYNWFYNGEFGIGSSLTSIYQYHDIVLKFADTDTAGVFADNAANASVGYRYMRYANRDAAKPEFAPFIKTKTSYNFQEFGLSGKANIPVAVFDQITGKRLDVGFLEENSLSGMVDGRYFPSTADNNNTNISHEILFIFSSEYSTTVNPSYSQADREILWNTKYGPLPIMYFIQSGKIKKSFSSTDEMSIVTYKLYNTEDKYKFIIPAPTSNEELAKEDVNKINVFPNPYYGLSPESLSSSEERVTFTHLPERAVVRIFTVSGQLIRTLEKHDTGQFLTWDLKTDGNKRVPSGVFVARIEMPDLGMAKTVKIGVIQGWRYKTGF